MSGYAFHLSTEAKQPTIAFSTAEAEYIAVISCATQAIWMRRMLEAMLVIEYYPIEEQVADIFTKPLKAELFYKLKKMFRIVNVHT
ncbi:hypothetical protein CR513_61575, partial [Mucuna pruriens]